MRKNPKNEKTQKKLYVRQNRVEFDTRLYYN